jgi:predicted DsbA family dithiol-disulfide isomerase
LLANQNRFGNAYYEEVATQLGMNLVRFNRDRRSQSAYAAIAKDAELADRLGLKGTPFFVVNGQGVSGVVTSQDLEAMLSAPTPTVPNGAGVKPSN